MHILTPHFNTVSLDRGDRFQIHLPGLPSAGYVWSLDLSGPEAVVTDEKNYVQSPDALGGAVLQVFNLVAQRSGTVTITAIYKRPWEALATKKINFIVGIS